ncbi:hypothetical protein Tco_0971531 [Tanacetum coccineum]
MVQSYVTRGPVHDKEKVAREKEQDYDIPLQDHVMQPLTPQTVHITPPDDNYVAQATNPILNKHLNEFGEEFANNTRVFKKIDSSHNKELEFEVFSTRSHVVKGYGLGGKRLLNRRFARILLLHLSLDEESNTQGSPLF